MHIGKWKIENKDFVWLIVCLIILLCVFIGLIVYKDSKASEVLSGSSTAISIVLSIVAILYTMIEGSNTSRVNEETIAKLNSLDEQLDKISQKNSELQELKSVLDNVVPKVCHVVEKIEEQAKTKGSQAFNDETKKRIDMLKTYVDEDLDD